MIKKVYVPKYLYPLSAVAYNYVIFLISLLVLAIVSVILGVKPTIYLLQALVPAAYYPAFLLWKRNASCNHRRIFPGY